MLLSASACKRLLGIVCLEKSQQAGLKGSGSPPLQQPPFFTERAYRMHCCFGTRWRFGPVEGEVKSVEGDKAVYTTQKGKQVAHKLETLTKHPDKSPSTEDMPEEEKEQMRQEYEEETGHR